MPNFEFVNGPATASIDPSKFTTDIDNPYMTLKPGTTFVYSDKDGHTIDYFEVTHETRVVNGVTCVQVHDIEYVNGEVSEDTLDWFAQDEDGNVWYFGELTQEYEPGNPNPIGFAGSWEAGINGARAGIIMLADPEVGDFYKEEHARGVAEDEAEVVSLHKSAKVVYGKFDDLLLTKNTTPLEPDVLEHKYYAAGIGTILVTDNEGGFEQLIKVKIDGTTAGETLSGYAGKDDMAGWGGQDQMFGLAGADLMSGGDGNDLASGGRGGDKVGGDAGNDMLSGDGGRDALAGGLGNDLLTGGRGADLFVFGENDGSANDIIMDYSLGQGDAIGLNNGADAVVYDALVNGVWQLTLWDGHVIVLNGVDDANHNGHIIDNVSFIDV